MIDWGEVFGIRGVSTACPRASRMNNGFSKHHSTRLYEMVCNAADVSGQDEEGHMLVNTIGRGTRRNLWVTRALGALVAAVATAQMFAVFPSAQTGVQVRVVSNPRPDMVSGGDALVQVDVPAGVSARDVRVTLNNADVTSKFRADAAGRMLVGLVDGLTIGSNTITAGTTGGAAARLTLVNHPNTGPVFSVPQETPFICETQNFKLLSGGTLGPALDANCSIATRVDYLYRSSAGGALKPLADPQVPPADLATATTITGQTVPFIVRIETGTINRSVYQIAMLHNPAT